MKTLTLFQETKTKLVNVALPVPVDDPFTYEIPSNLIAKIKPGIRLLVPFRNREMIGYAVELEEEVPALRIKKVVAVLDETPVVSDHLLHLARWMGQFYFSSWGEAIQTIMPKPFRRKERTNYRKLKDKTDKPPAQSPSFELTSEQREALQTLQRQLRSSTFHANLLFGVTGSGKSEIYIRAIKEANRLGKTAICLVPEIALTEQLKHFFGSHFGPELEIVHSKLSEGERWFAWQRIHNGEKQVVLGARSAIFAPFENLGLIIIDEEHESSYKQDQNPRYHARDVAKWRAKNSGSVLVLGSATPSLETLHEAKQGSIHQIELTKRVDSKKLPSIEIVDLNQADRIAKKRVIISPKLQSAIRQALDQKEGIMLLLNRRGFSTFIHCESCRHPLMCRHCDVPLTFHQAIRKLVCHYCNFSCAEPSTCPNCGASIFKFAGVGTEKVESEVARYFPAARIARLDSDTTRRKGSHLSILADFRNQKIDILVGTQMIAKGFDFPHVTLVGVVLADTALVLPDFRSSEKTFQLITQVAGRSGRGDKEGKVIVQTYSPFHYSIQLAREHDTKAFFDHEMKHRQNYKYPPFVRLINIMLRGKEESRVMDQATTLKQALRPLEDLNCQVIGPAPLPFYKLRGHFRWHIMIKYHPLQSGIGNQIRQSLKKLKRSNLVHIAIDSDPLTIL